MVDKEFPNARADIYNDRNERTNIFEGYIKENKFHYKVDGIDLPYFGIKFGTVKELPCDYSKRKTHGKEIILEYVFDGKDYIQIDPLAQHITFERSPNDFIKGVEHSITLKNRMMPKPGYDAKAIAEVLLFMALIAGIFLNYLQGQSYQSASQNLVAPQNKTVQLIYKVLPEWTNITANFTKALNSNTRAITLLETEGGVNGVGT